MEENKGNKKVDMNKVYMSLGNFLVIASSFNFTIGNTPINSIPSLLMSTINPYLLPTGIGSLGFGALFGIYRILTKNSRERKKLLEDMRNNFNLFFEGAGIKNKLGEFPNLIDIKITDTGIIYSFINPIGMSTHDYNSKDIAIREFLNCKNISFELKGDLLNIVSIETDLPKVVPFILPEKKSDELIVKLGVNELGEEIEINFSKIHSWLIAGATGSGKSVCIHNILTQLYCNYSCNTDFYICDLKKTELNNYRRLSSTVEYVDNVEDVENIIDELLKICDERHSLFIKYNVKNLQQYNKKVKKSEQLNNIVLCIEECVRLMNDKKLQAKIAELAFIARSAGIIIIMTVQRATKNLMSPDIKASLLGKIGFKVVSRINSQVIMDDNRLFDIKERGECCVSCEDISIGETRIKVMYLEEHRIDKILKKHCKYK